MTWTDGPVPTKVIRDSKTLGSDGFEALFSMPEWKTEFLMYAEDARMPVWTKLIMKEVRWINGKRVDGNRPLCSHNHNFTAWVHKSSQECC